MFTTNNDKKAIYIMISLFALIFVLLTIASIFSEEPTENLIPVGVFFLIFVLSFSLVGGLFYLLPKIKKHNLKKLNNDPQKIKKYLNKSFKVGSYLKLDDGYEELTLSGFPGMILISYKNNNQVDIIKYLGYYGSIAKSYYRINDFKDNEELFETVDTILQTYKVNNKQS